MTTALVYVVLVVPCLTYPDHLAAVCNTSCMIWISYDGGVNGGISGLRGFSVLREIRTKRANPWGVVVSSFRSTTAVLCCCAAAAAAGVGDGVAAAAYSQLAPRVFCILYFVLRMNRVLPL